MNNKTLTERRSEIKEQEAQEQEAFDERTEAYITTSDAIHDPERDRYASTLDTNNREPWELHPDKCFKWATPNWNDAIIADSTEMWEHCGQVVNEIEKNEALSSHEILIKHSKLLDNSFSEHIKQHIVKLTSSTEPIEGACKHCLHLYGEVDRKNREIEGPIQIWHTLCNTLGTAIVYNAFLERAWHLTPTSPYFPDRYQDIIDTCRASELDTQQRQAIHYANPYAQLQELNETAKRLRYALQHTTDAKEISKLANSQVRILGAIHVINNKLESTHQQAIKAAERKALKGQ